MTSGNQDQLYAHRFQGNPVNILLLRKSAIASELQNNSIEEKLFFKNDPTTNVDKPKNNPRKSGIKINENGIKNLKLSSNVKE
jgi:hypothetical protein